jgi:hypothetical protein
VTWAIELLSRPGGLDEIPSEDLYKLLKATSELRSSLWDEIATRPSARALLSPQESKRMRHTHPV